MKKYGALDAELKDTPRNNAQLLRSTLQVERLTHCHKQETYGVRYADNQDMDLKIVICCRNKQRLQRIYTARSIHQ